MPVKTDPTTTFDPVAVIDRYDRASRAYGAAWDAYLRAPIDDQDPARRAACDAADEELRQATRALHQACGDQFSALFWQLDADDWARLKALVAAHCDTSDARDAKLLTWVHGHARVARRGA